MKTFCAKAAEAGADGVLLTDMIVEEAGEYLEAMQENKLAPVFLAAPTSPDARLKAIAGASQGFVYAISRVGITGTQQKVAGDAAELVARLRKFTKLPIAVGFGISNAEHVKAVGEFADAAVIGSALVALIEKTPPGRGGGCGGTVYRGVAGMRFDGERDDGRCGTTFIMGEQNISQRAAHAMRDVPLQREAIGWISPTGERRSMSWMRDCSPHQPARRGCAGDRRAQADGRPSGL